MLSAVVVFATLWAGGAGAQRIPTHFAAPNLAPRTRLFLLRRAHELSLWGLEPTVLAAVLRSNARATSRERIAAIDAEWRAGGQHALAGQLVANECAQTLRALLSTPQFRGYRDAFATDGDGEVVCATERTTRYWLGDEEKWRLAHNDGRGGIYVGAGDQVDGGLSPIELAVPVVYADTVVGVLAVAGIAHALEDEASATVSAER